MSTIAFAVLIPLLLHITLTMVMKNIFIYSLDKIPYEIWVFPGIVLLVSILSAYAVLYRDLFDLRIHKKSFIPITLAPYSKFYLVGGFLLTAIVESLIYGILSMIILSFLLSQSLHWYSYIAIPLYGFTFLFLFVNLLLTISILSERITTFLSMIIILFFFMIFGTGILFEFEFYPKILGTVLTYNPFSLILSELRGFLFSNHINWIWILVPILTGFVWTWINGFILKRTLKQ
jgi:ABC-type polysaccharide/polyol phosphate export permease|tara:strand:+ start:7396 stop:8094 length:699 start_codon:yes stop_codon:yes gene_type:complete